MCIRDRLESGREYAIVLLSPSSLNYKLWISEMGETTIETRDLDEADQAQVGQQYLGGSLFLSQNGTIWTPTQTKDLKFTLYKCSFINTPGSLTLYNKTITSNDQLDNNLSENSLKIYPRKLRVGITPRSDLDTSLTPGVKAVSYTHLTLPTKRIV